MLSNLKVIGKHCFEKCAHNENGKALVLVSNYNNLSEKANNLIEVTLCDNIKVDFLNCTHLTLSVISIKEAHIKKGYGINFAILKDS